jgi:glycosyltransferase involved in cell wall biosynthesis
MRIAIQAADLDAKRVDGTRVYIRELLRRFGELAPDDRFVVCHRDQFNPELAPPELSNYELLSLPGKRLWMQTAFAQALFSLRPDRIFVPLQAAPVATPEGAELVVTVHDLAFRFFPETFPATTRAKLNLLLGVAVGKADRIIAVSESTKSDLIRAFPDIPESKVYVVHHGVNASFFSGAISEQAGEKLLARYGLTSGSYILYVGAIQPRKNLIRLVEAFERSKKSAPGMRLVLVGEEAWLSDPIIARIENSPFATDIIRVGQAPMHELPIWYQHARLFAFPSLYEGFGLPILEAFSAGTPVLAGEGSSLPEVGGDAALYVDPNHTENMSEGLVRLWNDESLCEALVQRGYERVREFSWDRCAEKTLAVIRGEA